MWVWRRILKISWTKHKTNEEVLNIVKEKRKLMETIRRRQKNWIGHILCRDSLLDCSGGKNTGKQVSGRPRITMLDWMKDKDRGYKEVKEKLQNRNELHWWTPGPVNRQR